jgi:hypothetical protein
MKTRDFLGILFVLFVGLGVTFVLFGTLGACDGGTSSGVCHENAGSGSGVSSSRLYYPCNIDDMSNVGATTVSGGFTNSKEDMYWLADYLASEGLVVLAISLLLIFLYLDMNPPRKVVFKC